MKTDVEKAVELIRGYRVDGCPIFPAEAEELLAAARLVVGEYEIAKTAAMRCESAVHRLVEKAEEVGS